MEQNSLKTQRCDAREIGVSCPEADLATDTVVIPVKLCNLPPLNAIASQVLALSADPDIDLGQLSDIMRQDPAFAADVLFLANSSLFGFPQRMHSLRHALAVLGLERLRALAVTIAMRGFVGKGSPLVHQCWRHSAACALICEQIAQLFGVATDVAYTVGLMHDIGLLGFLKCYPKETEAVLSTELDSVERVLAAERTIMQVDHGRAGSWLVKSWAFPHPFAECCEHHHDAFDGEDTELLKVVKVACRFADAMGFAAWKVKNVPDYDAVIGSLLPPLAGERFPPASELEAAVEARLAFFL